MSREKIMASIDIGSQSVQMLLARFRADGRLEPINEFVANTKLCESLSPDGAFSEAAMNNTVQAAKEMQDIAMKEGAVGLIVTARSAIREASNRSAFLLLCHQRLNIYPQLLSGKDEARLNYLGASTLADAQKPLVVVGIGMVSSQIAYGAKGSITNAASFNFGASTIERLHGLGAGASGVKQKAAAAQIKAEIQEFSRDAAEWMESLDSKPEALATGSLANCLAAIIRRQPMLDFKTLELTHCTNIELLEQYKKLARLRPKERLAEPGVDVENERNLVSGLYALSCILEALKIDEFRTSAAGLRSGVLKYFTEK